MNDSSGKGQNTDFLVHPKKSGIEKLVSHRKISEPQKIVESL